MMGLEQAFLEDPFAPPPPPAALRSSCTWPLC